MDIETLKEQVCKIIDIWYRSEHVAAHLEVAESVKNESQPERKLPEGKRVVRTKSSGDRVYLLDDVKKTRQWVTNPEVLKSLGFEMGDVVDVEDNELLKYQMAAALYRVDNA